MSDVDVAEAIKNMIFAMSPALVPISTLTANATAGTATITVDSTENWNDGSVAVFADALGETWLRVTVTDSTHLAIDLSGTGLSGLAHTHTTGTKVYTNLFAEWAPLPDPMIALGWPCISVMVMLEDQAAVNMPKGYESGHSVHIHYTARLHPSESSQMDTNVWALTQVRKARIALETIAAVLKRNDILLDPAGNNAVVGLGPLGGGGSASIRKDWRQLVENGDAFTASLNVLVREQAPYR